MGPPFIPQPTPNQTPLTSIKKNNWKGGYPGGKGYSDLGTNSSPLTNTNGVAPNGSENYIDGLPDAATHATDGSVTVSAYGGAGDTTSDSNSARGIGNNNNQLISGSVALSPDVIAQLRPRAGQEILVNGVSVGYFDDTTASTYNGRPIINTVDIYNANGALSNGLLKNAGAGSRITLGTTVRPQNRATALR
jgi:hypothetical protein